MKNTKRILTTAVFVIFACAVSILPASASSKLVKIAAATSKKHNVLSGYDRRRTAR